ncbi:hypothetical protein [Flavobacterium selenitireducens]|uniref:hypothetical protein n=1 Tax=Flavobacterium selenitireducens TaxID=2722704 RepID=UPI00168BFFAB|nr:hypothetical protein [Flavobacterium selenitireducens]MBD3583577.1 hypothetical protein [Flavobacterium selenitireducens]
MKKLLYLFALAGVTALTGCEGDPGPAGAPGEEAFVYEITNVNFTPAGDFGVFFDFPDSFLASDHVLVYRLANVVNQEDVWKPLPETFYFDDGTLDFMYGFDHTQFDVNVYMEGFDLAGVSPDFRSNQVFRVVVIPGQFAKSAVKVDLNDYKAVIKAYGIDESKIIELEAKAKAKK